MAKRKIPSPTEFLKDLFSKPPAVSQDHIEEFARHTKELDRLHAAFEESAKLVKIDLEVVRSEITEMLLLGCPVEPGPLRIVIAPTGKLVVSREEEQEQEVPF